MANGIVLNIDTTKSEFQNPMVQLRQGDGNYQSLDVTVTSNGEPLDLTGWTVTFMGTTAGGFKIVDSAITVTNALQGEFTYTPTKAWGQDQGEFKNAYFKFTKADETASGASFRVNVLEAVDLTAEEAGNYISVVDVLINDIKTSMDTKLADTQKTLSDTQSQSNTVQTNVNELNNNVNELKAQNNAIKTTDNTWSGTNTFNKLINGALNTRTATFTDFADVAKHMDQYAGNWVVSNKAILNSPIPALFYMVYVFKGSDSNDNGYIIVTTFNDKVKQYITVINNGVISGWYSIANDHDVLHNTGNETVAGNKTFTGSNTFSGINNFNAAQNFNGGVIGLGYSSLLNSGNGLSVIASGAQQTTDSGQSWHKLANDDSVVHITGTENITGAKTFSSKINASNGISLPITSTTPIYYSGFSDYNTDNVVTLNKWGNFVQMSGIVKNNDVINSGNNTAIFNIPVGWRPIKQMRPIEKGSGTYRYQLIIATNGDVSVINYSSGGSDANIASSSTLYVDAVFLAPN